MIQSGEQGGASAHCWRLLLKKARPPRAGAHGEQGEPQWAGDPPGPGPAAGPDPDPPIRVIPEPAASSRALAECGLGVTRGKAESNPGPA
jgi:hypothetical protein